jgi:hypothetical protein
MAYDGAHGVVVMFGGYTASDGPYLGDTWTWDGSRWTQKHPVSSPSPRYGAAMAYDAARGEIMLFGGYSYGTYFHETWTWDGANWEQETPSTAPSGRIDAAIAYDPVHSRIVLFGGGADGPALTDTWAWNSHVWTQLHPNASPPPHQGAVMIYDAVRRSLVMAASVTGEPSTMVPWMFNGVTWGPLQPATSAIPPPRYGPFMGGQGRQIVLFGGLGASDQWLWDGSRWRSVVPSHSPPSRGGGMQTATPMAYDACRHELLLFSGQGPSGWLTDTWTFDGATWSRRG